MQVLKDEVKDKIFNAAEEVFYQQDYHTAKLQDIAKKAGVTVGLIYTYFKNKESLFDAVVSDVYINFENALTSEDEISGNPTERFHQAGKEYVLKLLSKPKNLVILMDRSTGTKHMHAKEKLIAQLQKHIEAGLKRNAARSCDPMLAHILASNFTEGLLEIARHYRDPQWAHEMLEILTQVYYQGVESL